MFLVCMVLVGCSVSPKGSIVRGGGNSSTADPSRTGTGVPPEVVEPPPPPTYVLEALGLASRAVIGAKYAAATGVQNYMTVANIRNELNQVAPLLSSSGSYEGFEFAMLNGYSRIAFRFCEAALNRESSLPINGETRNLFKGVDISGGATVESVRASSSQLIDNLFYRFTQNAPSSEEKDITTRFVNSVNVVATTAPARTAGRNLLVATCTVVASSSEALKQ